MKTTLPIQPPIRDANRPIQPFIGWIQKQFRTGEYRKDPVLRYLSSACTPKTCWIWPLKHEKYLPRVYIGNSSIAVRRYIWELANGGPAVPVRSRFRVTCGNRSCVNPLHLEFGNPYKGSLNPEPEHMPYTSEALDDSLEHLKDLEDA